MFYLSTRVNMNIVDSPWLTIHCSYPTRTPVTGRGSYDEIGCHFCSHADAHRLHVCEILPGTFDDSPWALEIFHPEEESSLPTIIFQGPCHVKLWGCKFPISLTNPFFQCTDFTLKNNLLPRTPGGRKGFSVVICINLSKKTRSLTRSVSHDAVIPRSEKWESGVCDCDMRDRAAEMF